MSKLGLLRKYWFGASVSGVILYFAVIAVLSYAGTLSYGQNTPRANDSSKDRILVETVSPRSYQYPSRIIIGKIGVDSVINNPRSAEISILDEELKKGAVRYPGSALLGENANILLFGHSTGYKVVRNEAYKTFNKINELATGDLIGVNSDTHAYVYKVREVKKVNAEEALVKFETGRKVLTLSTCNTFGRKQERFVVTADFAYSQRLQ